MALRAISKNGLKSSGALPAISAEVQKPSSVSCTCTLAFGNATFLSGVSRPLAWSGCMWVRTIASTAPGLMPAAVRFLASRPSVGPNRSDVPVSTRTNRILRHEARIEELGGSRGIARENLGFERQPAVIEHG